MMSALTEGKSLQSLVCFSAALVDWDRKRDAGARATRGEAHRAHRV